MTIAASSGKRLEEHGPLATLELRNACKMDTKSGNIRFKRAILELQCMLIVVHFGTEQETNAWASGRYELTCRAFPKQTAAAKNISSEVRPGKTGSEILRMASEFIAHAARAPVWLAESRSCSRLRAAAAHRSVPRQNQRIAMKLVLASSSPRRAEVLRNAGFVFEVRPADVDETRQPHEAAEDYVRRIAQAKAHAVADPARAAGERAIVIAADTIVLAEEQILGKPKNAEDARGMLRLFNGKSHEVLTALCVMNIPDAAKALHVEKTRVELLKISA